MPAKERVFTNRKRKIFRKRFPGGELVASIVVAAVLIAAGMWVAAQKNAYDPSERDISMAIMEQSSVEDTLYETPLKLWVDPAQAGVGAVGPSLGMLPAAILDGGWKATTRIQEFDPDSLYEKIDGAAEQFLQYGFEKLTYLSLAQPAEGLELGLEVYDMGESRNAQGIFSAQKGADRAVVQAAKAMYYPTGSGAVALIGKYYVKIAGNEARAEEKAEQMVAALEILAGEAEEKPLPVTVLEAAGIDPGAVAYHKADVFQFAFAKDFWFGTPQGGGDMQFYVHAAEDEITAQALFSELLAAHTEWDYAVVDQQAAGAVLKHKFLETYLTLHQRGTLIFGVEYAPNAEAAQQADATLSEAIAHDGQSAEEEA